MTTYCSECGHEVCQTCGCCANPVCARCSCPQGLADRRTLYLGGRVKRVNQLRGHRLNDYGNCMVGETLCRFPETVVPEYMAGNFVEDVLDQDLTEVAEIVELGSYEEAIQYLS